MFGRFLKGTELGSDILESKAKWQIRKYPSSSKILVFGPSDGDTGHVPVLCGKVGLQEDVLLVFVLNSPDSLLDRRS